MPRRVEPAPSKKPRGKKPKPGAATTFHPNFSWKVVHKEESTQQVAIDHSLAFHRLQEARRELHEARSGFLNLTAGERARLVAYYAENLARAELWVNRASTAEPPISPLPPLPSQSTLQGFSGGR